ncbi:MAG: hypothetical protein ACK49V_00900 [Actinomycetes bacterium]
MGDVLVPGTTVDVPAMARTSVVVVVPTLARTGVVEVARPTEVVGSSTMVVEVETSLVVVEVSESTVSSTASSEHREMIECSPLSRSSKSNSVGEDPSFRFTVGGLMNTSPLPMSRTSKLPGPSKVSTQTARSVKLTDPTLSSPQPIITTAPSNPIIDVLNTGL